MSEDELHTIADTIRARFAQQSVLTFDTLPAGSRDADALQLDVPGVTATALRNGLLADTLAIDGGAGQDTLDTSAFTAGTIGVDFTG